MVALIHCGRYYYPRKFLTRNMNHLNRRNCSLLSLRYISVLLLFKWHWCFGHERTRFVRSEFVAKATVVSRISPTVLVTFDSGYSCTVMTLSFGQIAATGAKITGLGRERMCGTSCIVRSFQLFTR